MSTGFKSCNISGCVAFLTVLNWVGVTVAVLGAANNCPAWVQFWAMMAAMTAASSAGKLTVIPLAAYLVITLVLRAAKKAPTLADDILPSGFLSSSTCVQIKLANSTANGVLRGRDDEQMFSFCTSPEAI